ncbi:patatin-like phospholipase family protein, partial [Clostridium saudiense]|nr:patatin-like phospholipase family protein [Clostridium saudiense]
MITKNIDDIKIGLVLSGGGAKGAYEAGVFKAIEDLNISQNVSVISGTSIGTVNGLMFSMDDSSILKSSWASVNYSR